MIAELPLFKHGERNYKPVCVTNAYTLDYDIPL